MKLDFSALAQPAPKVRGQVGTTGTPASTRVFLSPLTKPSIGMPEDRPAVVVLAADPVVVNPTACPPMSPPSPEVTEAEKLIAGAVSPVSPLVPIETAQVAAAAPTERVDLADEPTEVSVNNCGACVHLLRHGTCDKPLAAGLLTAKEGFGIVRPPEGHGATCQAFARKMPTAAADRFQRLTYDQADSGGRAPSRDDAELAWMFQRS